MPLLDRFHPPLFPNRHWESFHVTWAGAIADALNEEFLPDGYFAEEHAHAGARVEIDVATFLERTANASKTGLITAAYAPPTPTTIIPAAFPDEFEIRVFEVEGGSRLVAAIELISPANKDRELHRQAFANKCAGYLAQGIALIVVDVVTSRSGNLHAEIMGRLGSQPVERGGESPSSSNLYAAAYRPIVREEQGLIEVWTASLTVGQELPALPLALSAEVCIPVDLEATYTSACNRRRLG